MNDQAKPTPEERLAEARRCEAAVQRAVRDAVLASAYAGKPVPAWRDGKVVWLTPEQVFVEMGAPGLVKPDDKTSAA